MMGPHNNSCVDIKGSFETIGWDMLLLIPSWGPPRNGDGTCSLDLCYLPNKHISCRLSLIPSGFSTSDQAMSIFKTISFSCSLFISLPHFPVSLRSHLNLYEVAKRQSSSSGSLTQNIDIFTGNSSLISIFLLLCQLNSIFSFFSFLNILLNTYLLRQFFSMK